LIGKTLAHYQISELIGRGGMGEVYRARDTKLGRDVALKVLPADMARDTERQARFQREASVIAALKHPNIVTIYSVEEDEGVHFITMELVEGETLSEKIPTTGLSLAAFLDAAISLADALDSAHGRGIVHRDLKPTNIMFDADGRVKILDFGLAKLVETIGEDDVTITSDGRTVAGQVIGTLAYMSPEQAEGLSVDHRSDIFSLGIVLYQMATGTQPFRGPNAVSTLSAILKNTPPPVAEHNRALPGALNGIVERCLSKDPDHRYQSAAELRDDLQEVQRTAISGVSPAPPAPRRSRFLVPVAVAVLAVIALAGWWWQKAQKADWARNEALPAIEEILDSHPSDSSVGNREAFLLDRQAYEHAPDDPRWADLRRRYSRPLTVHSDPPGARVFARPYGHDEIPWDDLGTTPIDTLAYVAGVIELKLELEGYRETEDVIWNRYFQSEAPGYTLQEEGRWPEEMVWVAGSAPKLYIGAAPAGIHLPGIEHLDGQAMGDFLIDRYEVSNRQYQAFVDAGGYTDQSFWTEPFRDGDQELDFASAMVRFRDRTGRAGPSTWEAGSFPAGKGEHPVSGISWFEAMAYAEFAGKSLPTIYHWDHVALAWASSEIVPFSNLAGTEIQPTGGSGARNRYGTHDLGGNVREWCVNPDNRSGRFILGGGYDDPPYAFNDAFAQSPWDRSQTNGVRCIRYVETSVRSDALTAEIELPFRDFASEPRVSDETFALFLNQYLYDPTPLNAVVEDTREEEFYVRERIVFDAAYGGETMAAYLFLPRNGVPPYQTVVYFPGSGAIHQRSSENLTLRRADFVPKSGRAVLWPVYKSTYERGDGLVSDYPDETSAWKDHIIMWGKDLKRSIDYLETRDDIDTDRLAFMGASWGAAMGPILMAIEPRIKAGVVLVAGLNFQKALPEVDQLHYLHRVDIPVLMLNGKYDFFFPYETSQRPYFELMKTPAEHKRLVVHDAGHSFPRTEMVRETLEWLDRYLGEVR
jgi:formylglycine-generating enzyme required for sulfatase activity/tRNA A-37 threonylcarbamoyl transferase component Bud32/dienelactone hydrolase